MLTGWVKSDTGRLTGRVKRHGQADRKGKKRHRLDRIGKKRHR